MRHALVTYMVGDAVIMDWLSGNDMSTQAQEGGTAMIVFPAEDGELRESREGQPVLTGIRAVHYAEAARIVKMTDR